MTLKSPSQPLNILVVTAHPDDEVIFAGAIYKITHALKGHVDLVLFTDGAGGYRWSTLAQPLYGIDLTEEHVAHKNLPGIRKRELISGGKIIGIRKYFYLDQFDDKDIHDVDEIIKKLWNTKLVKHRLQEILESENYDFIFAMLPFEETHGHHQASTILMLEALESFNGKRPVILGARPSHKSEPLSWTYHGLHNYPITYPKKGAPIFSFDRTQPIGLMDRLDYNVIVNWVIAEHKTQGAIQLAMNRWNLENFWVFEINDASAVIKAEELFSSLQK